MLQNDTVPDQLSDVIQKILSQWSAEEKKAFLKLQASELDSLKLTLGLDIRNQFLLWSGNPKLIEACRKELDQNSALQQTLWSIFYQPFWQEGILVEEDQKDISAEEEKAAFLGVFSEMDAYLASELIMYLTWSYLQKNPDILVQ